MNTKEEITVKAIREGMYDSYDWDGTEYKEFREAIQQRNGVLQRENRKKRLKATADKKEYKLCNNTSIRKLLRNRFYILMKKSHRVQEMYTQLDEYKENEFSMFNYKNLVRANAKNEIIRYRTIIDIYDNNKKKKVKILNQDKTLAFCEEAHTLFDEAMRVSSMISNRTESLIELDEKVIQHYIFADKKNKETYILSLIDIDDNVSDFMQKYRELESTLMYHQHWYEYNLTKESYKLDGKVLLQYFYDNTQDYRKNLVENNLLDANNKIKVLSCILKFVQVPKIQKRLKAYLCKILNKDDFKKLVTTIKAVKQKQYYKRKVNSVKELVKREYTSKIISHYVDDELALKSIKTKFESELNISISERFIRELLEENGIKIRSKNQLKSKLK